MPGSGQDGHVIRFGVFEADFQAGELRKSGVKIKLQEQPFQILALLLEHPGQVVTREELQQRLWPADTFVEFDNGLNTAIKKLREALGDSADNARFVETLPRRGYRLVVPVTGSDLPSGKLSAPADAYKSRRTFWYFSIAALALVGIGSLAFWKNLIQTSNRPRVLSFRKLTNDGQVKTGPLVTDGSRIYFNETLPGPHNLIAQVAVTGGEVVPVAVQLKEPQLFDLSKEQTELLIGSGDGINDPALWIQSVAGGSPRRVGTILAGDARFGPDGILYNHGYMHDVYAANRDGSGSRKIISTDGEPYSFRYSPDGKILRFSQADDQRDLSTIMETAAGGVGLHKLFEGCCGKWTSDGKLYVFERKRDGRTDLWALSEAKRFSWRQQAEQVQLTAGPMNFTIPLPNADGKQLFAIGEAPRAEVVRYDSRTGQFVPYLSGISADGLAFSRDGQWVTYTSYPDGALWRSKIDGSERLQLTFSPLRAFLPRWSPDGKQIAFNGSTSDAGWSIYLIAKDGGTPERIFPSEQSQMDVTWSSDGNALAFATTALPDMPIYTIDLKSRHVSALPGSANLFSPRWSPDGKYIAAIASNRPLKLVLFEFATQKWTDLYGFDIGYLSWSHDSKYIYFQRSQNPGQDVSVQIARVRLVDRKIENIVAEKNVGRLITGTFPDWFDLAPDDSPLFARDISSQEIYALDVQWP
jgi:Tol biopolymer transport system component/DNA-binding winged helix-turn-helix (wHTH) protein